MVLGLGVLVGVGGGLGFGVWGGGWGWCWEFDNPARLDKQIMHCGEDEEWKEFLVTDCLEEGGCFTDEKDDILS